MGNKYELWEWVKVNERPDGTDLYNWVLGYTGSSFLGALYLAWKAKRRGIGCVRIEWR